MSKFSSFQMRLWVELGERKKAKYLVSVCVIGFTSPVHGMGEHRHATGGGWRSEDHPEYLALFLHVVPGIELRLSGLVINAFSS